MNSNSKSTDKIIVQELRGRAALSELQKSVPINKCLPSTLGLSGNTQFSLTNGLDGIKYRDSLRAKSIVGRTRVRRLIKTIMSVATIAVLFKVLSNRQKSKWH